MNNKELYYHITYNKDGIYNALKKKITEIEWCKILSLEEIKWLPKPPVYNYDSKSYFTKKGYEKFDELVMPIIHNYLDKNKINLEVVDKLENIIYQDEYQVVTRG